MKKKIIVVAIMLTLLVCGFVVSASAIEVTPFDTTTLYMPSYFSAADVPTLCQLAKLCYSLGYCPARGDQLLIAAGPYASNGRYFEIAFIKSDSWRAVSLDGTSFKFTLNTTAYRYRWTGENFFYSGMYSMSSQYSILLSNLIYLEGCDFLETNCPDIIGINDNFAFGTSDFGFNQSLGYYSTMYNYITNYETDVQNALTTGQSYGYQMGKADCEATHGEGTYQDGYDFGYSSGYYVGLYDCDKTHQALKDEAFADGRAQGAMQGYADCQSTHPALIEEAKDEGYAAGDADGYMRGLLEGGQNKQEELDLEYWRGRSDGYDYGYTQALESSGVVLDYVDGIFSAPINFLYRAFNIEILGINIFNVLMLFLSLLIVGGVCLLVFKFR